MFKPVISIVVLVLQVCCCYAQPGFSPEHIDISTTRSGNHVLTIFEDSRGFIWLGTMKDLVRYDGFSFKKYNYGGTQADITINSVAESRNGDIWCSSNISGLLQLKMGKYGFDSLIAPRFKTPLPNALKIAFDKKGNLWGISQRNQLFTINMADSSVRIWPIEHTGSLEFLGFTENGKLWISGFKGAFYMSDFNAGALHKVIDTMVRKAVIEENTIYFFTSHKIYKVKDTAHTATVSVAVNLNPNVCRQSFFLDATTNALTPYIIAIIFNRQPILVDKTNNNVIQYAFDGINTSKYEIYSCYLSSAGKLYFGTSRGFFRIGLGNKAFKSYTVPDIKFRSVVGISDDTLLFGTHGLGPIRYIRNANDQWIIDKIQPAFKTKKEVGNTINRFYRDHSGKLWAATNAGLAVEDKGKWKFVMYEFGVWSITQDEKDNFWVGANGSGLIKFDAITGKRQSFLATKSTDSDNNRNRIWKTQYYKGKIYIGTAAGMFEFNPETKIYKNVFDDKFKDIPVWDFFISDTLWVISTQGKGLWLFRPGKGKPEQVETAQNYHYSLAWAGNSLWVISDKGVMANLWPGALPVNFTSFDGLNTDYFSFTGIATLGKDHIALCGENGFTVVNTATALKEGNKISPGNLFVSSLKYTGLPVADFLPNGSIIELGYEKGQLLIEWAASHFQQNKNKLYYKLNGVDEEWNISSTDNKITYSNLLPGTYVFTAYITGENESNTRYNLVIKIIPPFWLTPWFKIVVVAFVAILLAYIVYSWMARQKLKHAQLKSEIDALRAQINPHFIFNALNSIQAYIYSESKGEANEYLAKFASLMRKILENSRDEIITLQQEQVFLSLYLEMEALRFRGNLTYEIIVTPECLPQVFKIPSMLIQPIIENALKHGVSNENDKLHIQVLFSVENNTLICQVVDNGKGFKQQETLVPKKSLGLRLVNERLFILSKIYHKEYSTIIGNNAAGTTGAFVKLIIPQHN